MKIAVPKERAQGETRVALVPDVVALLVKAGWSVAVETGAGTAARFRDSDYEKVGAKIAGDYPALVADADIVAHVQRPSLEAISALRAGTVVIGFLQPAAGRDYLQSLAERRVTAFALELIPRISRAQSMDALSSQATVAGYKAVLLAAVSLNEFPMLTTAAGTIFAAKVLVLGAGVAGLQAIATARRLGAVVWGYDVRPAVKEQVESLGAKFLEFDLGAKDTEDKGGYARELSPEAKQKQQALLAEKMKEFDVVITTALIPGRPAPRLINRDTVEGMRPGSVIVDLAAEAGGNCELTQPGQTIEHGGVIIHGPLNLPGAAPVHASQMFGRNVTNLLKQLVVDGKLNLDFNDDIVKSACITHDGQVRG